MVNAKAPAHTNGSTNGSVNGSLNGSVDGQKHQGHGKESLAYRIDEMPFESPRPIKVICIGSGFSGLYLALRIQQRCQNVELVIYEKNEDVGGTWFENRYPGVGCDVPAHIYCYSFEGDANWSEHYAGGSEILQYLRRCAEKFRARQFIRFQHKVTSAIWNHERARWNLEVEHDGQILHDSAEILINAGGFLNAWKWPDIPGIESFEGKLLHTAAWDTNFDATGKNIAVIGSGSSALQVTPQLQPIVKHMDAYIRSATYIPEPLSWDFLEQEHCKEYKGDRKYSETDKSKFANDPQYLLKYRKTIESGMNGAYSAMHAGTAGNDAMREAAIRNMRKCLTKKPEMLEWLIPKWSFGCRRPSPGLGWLEAISSDNVDVVRDNISAITSTGIKTEDGKVRAVDAIVCATGFDVSWRPRFTLKGKDGFELTKEWAEEPRSYCSIAIEHMPNYFIFNGPYNCGGNGNAVPPIEVEGDYMIQCINKIQRQNIRSMTPQLAAIEDFVEHADALMPRMAWAGTCRNWYRTKSGRVVGTWPSSSLVFHLLMQKPRWEDYDYEYVKRADSKTNRFSFLGNGTTVNQADGTEDLSPYLNNPAPALLS